MRRNKIIAFSLISIMLFSFTGCSNPLQTNKKGTAYLEADIDRTEYVAENPIESKEMKNLIAEAEKAIEAMGGYIPEKDRQDMDAVLVNKEKTKEQIRNFLEKYPTVELDTTLPKVEISKDAFTWINEVLKELEAEKNEGDENIEVPELSYEAEKIPGVPKPLDKSEYSTTTPNETN